MSKKFLQLENDLSEQNLESKSGVCNITFENEAAFKDHVLTTIHKSGSPSVGILGRQEKLQSQTF